MNTRKIQNILSEWYYIVRSIFLPHNVIRIKNCPRTWHDRDQRLFHGVFQVLVDYIELEQPYISWDSQVRGRVTDMKMHRDGMEEKYNPSNRDKDSLDCSFYEKAYPEHLRIIELYEWYLSRIWEIDIYDFDKELEFRKECDDKLCEVVRLRHHFWT